MIINNLTKIHIGFRRLLKLRLHFVDFQSVCLQTLRFSMNLSWVKFRSVWRGTPGADPNGTARNWRFHRAIKNKLFYKTWDIFYHWDLEYTDFNRHMRRSISPRLAQDPYEHYSLIKNKIMFECIWGFYYLTVTLRAGPGGPTTPKSSFSGY